MVEILTSSWLDLSWGFDLTNRSTGLVHSVLFCTKIIFKKRATGWALTHE